MLINLVILWCCVGVFVATAIITLLALTKVLELADKKYLDVLFRTLIVEIVIVGVGMFSGLVDSPGTISDNLKEEGYVEGHEEGRDTGIDEGHNAAIRELQPKLDLAILNLSKLTDSSANLTPRERIKTLNSIQSFSAELQAMERVTTPVPNAPSGAVNSSQ